MFDINFWELAMVGAVALLVFGPDKLPEFLATIVKIVRRIRILLREGKYWIERELPSEHLASFEENLSDIEKLKQLAPQNKTSDTDKTLLKNKKASADDSK